MPITPGLELLRNRRLVDDDSNASFEGANKSAYPIQAATGYLRRMTGARLFLEQSKLLDGDGNLCRELRPDEWVAMKSQAEEWERLKQQRTLEAERQAALRARVEVSILEEEFRCESATAADVITAARRGQVTRRVTTPMKLAQKTEAAEPTTDETKVGEARAVGAARKAAAQIEAAADPAHGVEATQAAEVTQDWSSPLAEAQERRMAWRLAARHAKRQQALYSASYHGDLAAVERQLARGVEVNWRHPQGGATALYVASEMGHADVVARLLQAGAPPDEPRDDGSWPMYVASQGGHLTVVNSLLSAGAQVELAGRAVTPLWAACHRGEPQLMRALLAAKADPTREVQGWSTLQLARRAAAAAAATQMATSVPRAQELVQLLEDYWPSGQPQAKEMEDVKGALPTPPGPPPPSPMKEQQELAREEEEADARDVIAGFIAAREEARQEAARLAAAREAAVAEAAEAAREAAAAWAAAEKATSEVAGAKTATQGAMSEAVLAASPEHAAADVVARLGAPIEQPSSVKNSSFMLSLECLAEGANAAFSSLLAGVTSLCDRKLIRQEEQ